MESELEVKFCIPTLDGVLEQLQKNKASLHHARTYEKNLRLDTLDEALAHKHCVLRLRWDRVARCTYKGDSEIENGVLKRREIEFEVSDFDAALHLFQALGYDVSMVYEKYRTEYLLQDTIITLDEMPYGNFVEVEGKDGDTIQQISHQLKLVWEKRILKSYIAIFEKVKQKYNLPFQYLTFEHFSSLPFPIDILAVTENL